ncbi:MAG: molybdenum cofactor guanylyltransferase [Candidatus Abyssobacteria bacterium SURF_5]|uniref:Probable molybdenum cofactor guanylyltransferase n=1 Tax=Abyssobacteria bacterium (strain SURF_5) TaxID=2093360 RepID=A0A3A4PD12_ABYX5|nr:MAG: molybdenum cofactor guanylyltransferase [Candidatus Abyssubacteria bacterium SURF_5]
MESAVILAGGKSTRIGQNKALLDFGGESLIGRIYRILKSAFNDVFVSANDKDIYKFLGAPVIPDAFPGGGSLAGIHAGLLACASAHCFFVACDMPFINIELIRRLHGLIDGYDVIIPVSTVGYEPLHAFYSRQCLPHIQQQLEQRNLKVIDFFSQVRIREVKRTELQGCDPSELSYFNINTKDKYELALRRLKTM